MNEKLSLAKRLLSHYTNPLLSLDRRFVKPEEKSSKRLDKIRPAIYNEFTLKNFADYMLNAGFRLYIFEEQVTDLIGAMTMQDYTDEEIDGAVKYLLYAYSDKIKAIDIQDREKITFTLNDREVKAFKLSAKFPEIKEICPYIETSDRNHRCHQSATNVAMSFKNTTCVTGVQTVLSSNIKFLHSWVEVEKDGEWFVLDMNENVFMKRADYYKLFMVKPLERITHQQLWDDHNALLKLMMIDEKYSKLYLCSRAEALRIASRLPDNNQSERVK